METFYILAYLLIGLLIATRLYRKMVKQEEEERKKYGSEIESNDEPIRCLVATLIVLFWALFVVYEIFRKNIKILKVLFDKHNNFIGKYF